MKPANLGSSVGISKVHGPEELADALELAYRHDEKVLVEEFVRRARDRVRRARQRARRWPPPSARSCRTPSGTTTRAKYDEGGSDIIVPADSRSPSPSACARSPSTAFRALELSGMARVDCFLTPAGEVLVNEVNTIPGFTSTSVYARLFAAAGVSYPEVLDRLVQSGLDRHARRARYRY